jgi:hypothetical protein
MAGMKGMMYFIGEDGGKNNKPLLERVETALAYYRNKYQDEPSIILFNDSKLEEYIKATGSNQLTTAPDIVLKGYGSMVPVDIIWLGHIQGDK